MQPLAALLSGTCRLARRQTQSVLADLFGMHLSLSTLAALEADTAPALAAPHTALAEELPRTQVLERWTSRWTWPAVEG